MSDLTGIKKEYWSSESFRMILREANRFRPSVIDFRPMDKSKSTDEQIEEWKSKSAERRGFDLCFKMITGHNPEDLT